MFADQRTAEGPGGWIAGGPARGQLVVDHAFTFVDSDLARGWARRRSRPGTRRSPTAGDRRDAVAQVMFVEEVGHDERPPVLCAGGKVLRIQYGAPVNAHGLLCVAACGFGPVPFYEAIDDVVIGAHAPNVVIMPYCLASGVTPRQACAYRVR